MARLRKHVWVRDVRLSSLTAGTDAPQSAGLLILVVPSDNGLKELRRGGKDRLIDAWQREVSIFPADRSARIDWRLVDALPVTGHAASTDCPSGSVLPLISDLVVDPAGAALSCSLGVPLDLPVFRGHFPAKPIVPGVLLAGWVVELAVTHRLARGHCIGIEVAKFRRVVQPGMRLRVTARRDVRPGRVGFTYEFGGTTIATGRLQFESADG
jgi:3-hydroxymyristoyl/3-hydroxydecanoyl-(acyl carrier protein) dehydratase